MNESQERHLSVIMRGLEDVLLDIERTFTGPPDLIMTVCQDDPPLALDPEVRERIRSIRKEIRVIKERYGLHVQIVSNRHRIWTELAAKSVELTEALAKHMRAYGELSIDDGRALDERIGNMIELVEGLKELINVSKT